MKTFLILIKRLLSYTKTIIIKCEREQFGPNLVCPQTLNTFKLREDSNSFDFEQNLPKKMTEPRMASFKTTRNQGHVLYGLICYYQLVF